MKNERQTTVLFLLMIIGLIIALVAIVFVIINNLQNVDFGDVLGLDSNTNTVQKVYGAEPIVKLTNETLDYNFKLIPKTYNSQTVINQAVTYSNDPTLKNQQNNGPKDELITNEVRELTKSVNNSKFAGDFINIQVPSLGINSAILQGSNGDLALDQGMWMYPTSYAGGEKVLLCHRRFFGTNDPRSCWFLDRIKKEDIISLTDISGNVYNYKVIHQGVKPEDDLSIFLAGSDDLVKIITCTPLGSSSHRLVTIAQRI
jgi:LPXTG-site transpeptidase (sortase) family protein